jgi:hypothetical protein
MRDENRSRTGRKGPYAHYYIQVSPDGESFVGKSRDISFTSTYVRSVTMFLRVEHQPVFDHRVRVDSIAV